MSEALALQQFPYPVEKGEAGTLETVRRMAQIVWHLSHSARLTRFAREVIEAAGVEAYDGRGEVKALFDWVASNIRYTRDPWGYEWVQSVVPTLVTGHGDCDCQAVLLGALLQSVGYPVRLVIGGAEPGKFHHVFLQAQYRSPEGVPVWVYLDTTIPEGGGFEWRPHFAVLRAFQILPQGRMEEVSPVPEVSLYGLGEYLAELGAPRHNVTFHLSTGRSVALPWSAEDLRLVSDAELRGWILAEFDPAKSKWSAAELAELIGIVERLDTLPEMHALGFDDESLSGFWKKLGKGFKSAFKGIGKGLKKAVGSIPVIGKPIVGIAAGVKDAVKGTYKGFKSAFNAPSVQQARAQAIAKMRDQARAATTAATTAALAPLLPAQAPADASAAAASAEAPPSVASAAPRASVEIAPGAPQALPEVKSKFERNFLLAAGGVAAVGTGAYLYSKSRQ